MTDKDKQLLLVDLCARLPYGVKVQVYYEDIAGSGYFDETVWLIDNDEPFHVNDRWIENIKPYLRPMSSITNDEREILRNIDDFLEIFPEMYEVSGGYKTFDYLNSIHIDYRNLISLGLALPAPEGMYNCFKT